MAITFTIDGTEHIIPTLQDVLDVDNRVNELAANVFNNEEQIRLVKQILSGATPEPVREGITIGPEDNLQEAILDANGQKIWLKDGIYKPFKVVSNTKLQAINPGKTIIEGTIDWSDGWVKGTGVDVWSKELKHTFYQHPAKSVHTENGKPSARGMKHRAAMQPHMLVYKGTPMQPVYDVKDLKEGTFWLEGTSQSPVRIWAKLPGNASPSAIKLAVSQYLIKGMTGDVDGVEIDGLKLQFCANTGTFGAIHMEPDMEYWKISNTSVLWSMSEGIRMKGSNHLFDHLTCNYHGHLGIAGQGLFRSQLLDCEASYNVWRKGVDPLWHAGGLKWQYGCNENVNRHFRAVSNNGAGEWKDIYNRNNILEEFFLDDNMGFGCHIEHHTTDGVMSTGLIKNTRPIDLGNRVVQSDLRIQAGVTGYMIKNVEVAGDVYYKKTENRGVSGNNTFDNLVYGGKLIIEGDMNQEPDTYLRMTAPAN